MLSREMRDRKSILREIIKPHFKAEKFKIEGNHFKKAEREFIKIVNPQFSQFGTLGNLSFTFNLGFYFPSTSVFENENQPKSLTIHDCQINERFGKIFNNGIDYWCEVHDKKTDEEIDKEVNDMMSKITKWFLDFDTLDSLLALKKLKDTWSTYRMGYDVALGKLESSREDAIKLLEEELISVENKESNWANKLHKTLEKIKTE